jgi:hypothetical protein
MSKFLSVTATSTGVVYIYENGKSKFEAYGKKKPEITIRTGKFKDTKLAIKKPKKRETFHLNLIQRQMYRRIMYGLKEFSPEQIAVMGPMVEKKIINDYTEGRKAIHVMKAKKLYGVETRLINAIFQHIGNIGKNDHEWLLEIDKKYTLTNLEIGVGEIIDEFIRRRLLPKSFHQLDVNTVRIV